MIDQIEIANIFVEFFNPRKSLSFESAYTYISFANAYSVVKLTGFCHLHELFSKKTKYRVSATGIT